MLESRRVERMVGENFSEENVRIWDDESLARLSEGDKNSILAEFDHPKSKGWRSREQRQVDVVGARGGVYDGVTDGVGFFLGHAGGHIEVRKEFHPRFAGQGEAE